MNGQYIILLLAIFSIVLATRHLISGFIYGSIPIGSLLADVFPTYNLELFLLACFIFGAAMILRHYEYVRTAQTNK